MKTAWTLFLIFAAGLIILLLPDNGKPVIRFNKMHGPSLPDLAGLSLIMVSWLAGCMLIMRNWKAIKSRAGNRNVFLLAASYLLAISGIVLSLLLSAEWMLWLCTSIAALVNILFIAYAFRVAR
jgi:hypothetical protein